MKAIIEVKLITNTSPREGYLVFFKNVLYKIFKVENGIAELVVYTEYKPTETPLTISVKLEEISDCYIKFIAKKNNIYYSIIHGCYFKLISELLKVYREMELAKVSNPEKFNKEDFPINEMIEDMLENANYNIEIFGETKVIHTRCYKEDICEITDLSIIDKYKLYEPNKRMFTVKELDFSDNTIKYILSSNDNVDLTIITKRDKFKIVGKANQKDLFTINN